MPIIRRSLAFKGTYKSGTMSSNPAGKFCVCGRHVGRILFFLGDRIITVIDGVVKLCKDSYGKSWENAISSILCNLDNVNHWGYWNAIKGRVVMLSSKSMTFEAIEV